jgi:NAD(P)-dependent dehydrogenase (short-subunit alcohol dehydrogenase family)
MTLVPPTFRLDGRRAFVTGAGRGIGLSAAQALAEAGAHVTLAARSADEVEAGAAAIRDRGGSADALPLDVTDLDAVAKAVAQAPPFDIFLNNAGGNRPRPFVEVSVDDFDAIMGLNLRAAFFAAQAVARRMIALQRSAINRSVYCASKWAVEGMTKAMAIELGPHGIRVNTLCPTYIETPLTAPFLADPEFRDMVLGKIKLGRLEDLLGAILFLASDASSLMTGSALLIDGGWTAE